MKKVLIVEKQTNKEYEQYYNRYDLISDTRKIKLEEAHIEHKQTFNRYKNILENLANVEVISIKDFELDKKYFNADFYMAIGGDGTVLNTAHYINEEPFIAIKSSSSSYGYLTKWNQESHSKEELERIILDNDFKTEKIDRLYAKINGKKLDVRAINEVIIKGLSVHGTLSYQNKSVRNIADFSGDGVIISSKIGSTAYYQNAGGTPFDIDAIGYVLNNSGHLEKSDFTKSRVLGLDTTFDFISKRSNVYVSFDCSEKFKFSLNQSDVVEVGIDEENCLKLVL